MLKGSEEKGRWERELVRGCQQLGIRLSEDQVRSFQIYKEHIQFWNPSTGLVSPRDEDRLESRHFLDSLSLLTVLDLRDGARILDIGSGAGFPGLPLKICRPGILLTLLEPKEKRYIFLRSLVRTLGLVRVTLYCQRAQEICRESALREGFDLVLARGVAGMEKLVSLCFPFLRKGGVFVAYKGRRAGEEVARASTQIKGAGGELQGVIRVNVPGISEHRYLVLTNKLAGDKGVR